MQLILGALVAVKKRNRKPKAFVMYSVCFFGKIDDYLTGILSIAKTLKEIDG